MQLSDLISRFRTLANDKVEPYFIDDDSVIDWLNDAVNEACIRSRLLHESQNNDVCKIAVLTGSSRYQPRTARCHCCRSETESARS